MAQYGKNVTQMTHYVTQMARYGKQMADMNKSLSIIGWRDAVPSRQEACWPGME